MAKQYDTPLQLTSPHMVGQKVKDCQWLLSGHNRYDGLATYKDGAVDGDYGPLTAQATYKAKYWLGYPDKSLDKSFGQTLYEYLLKDGQPLPPDYVSRRKTRLAAIASNPGSKALDQALTQLGTKEQPAGSNRQKYGLWYGMNGVPWCSIFVSWSFAQGGYSMFRYSYVPFVHGDAVACKNRLSVVRTPRPGDAVCFSWGSVKDAHIGFFEKWLVQGSTFQTVEGNTGSASFNNGGAVERGTRYVSQVSAFVRVAA
jgi:CHAP domain